MFLQKCRFHNRPFVFCWFFGVWVDRRKANQQEEATMKPAFIKANLITMTFGIMMAGVSAQDAQGQSIVGTCVKGTQYPTIQAAVNATPSGAIIKVCPGGFPEQVVIEKPLTLEGMIAQGTEGALILPPSGGLVPTDPTNPSYALQILVTNTTGVTISNLIVDAANNTAACTAGQITGILFHNASGTVQKVSVRNQVANGAAPSQCSGYGLYALNDSSQQPNTVTLQNSDFRNQASWGITGEGAGLTLNTLNNFVSGPDNWPNSSIGIVYFGALSGTVQGNTVVNEVSTLPVVANLTQNSMGIAMACSNASVTGNMVSDTQLGLYIGCPFLNSFASNETVTQNKVFETRLGYGIYVNSNGNSITNNVIVGSGSAGILLDSKIGALGNTVSGNTITEACIGIDLTAAMGTNKLSNNTFNAVYVPTQKNAPACGPIFQ
jgi:parallel beta-helix repeat protein